MISISYLVNEIYYLVGFNYTKDSLGIITITGVYFFNLTEECAEQEKKPYRPVNFIRFESINWTTDYSRTTFRSGSIRISNTLEFDINYIKFKVILWKRNSQDSKSEIFFNQTVESTNPIYKGDIVAVAIPGMIDYFADFKIEKNNIEIEPELIEIKPKPISEWCLKVKKLDEKINKMVSN